MVFVAIINGFCGMTLARFTSPAWLICCTTCGTHASEDHACLAAMRPRLAQPYCAAPKGSAEASLFVCGA